MMKYRLKLLLIVLVIIPVLLACNLSQLVAATPAPGAAAQPGGPKPTAGQALKLADMEGKVRQLVTDFLASFQADPSGGLSAVFMTEALKQQAGGKPVQEVLGVPSVPKYVLSAVDFSSDALKASVDTTLLSNPPDNLRFNLVRSGNLWKIDQIVRLEGSQSYPDTPEQVAQTFLMAYQEAPEKMNEYLSKQRLQQMPAGGAVGLLNINGNLEGSVVQSASVSPNPPNASVVLQVRVGDKDLIRVFTLTKENGQWKIVNIEGQ